MKITYLVSQYPAYNHTFILREILALRESGVEVSVISIRDPDRPPARMTPVERREAEHAWYVKRRGLVGCLGSFGRLLVSQPLALIRAIRLVAKLAGADLRRLPNYAVYFAQAVMIADRLRATGGTRIHTHFASTVGLLAATIHQCDFSMTVHGPAEFDDPAFAMERKVRASCQVIVISQFARSQVLRAVEFKDWPKVKVVRLGVDTSAFIPFPPRPRSQQHELLSIGRLAAVKGQGILLEAVARLRARGLTVRLRVVGDGPERPRLERYATKLKLDSAVVFEGAQNQDRVRELFSQADVFVLSSFAEGVPVVLMEAMAYGVPCVATRINGVPELIRDGIDGTLVSAGDAAELSEAIARLLDNSSDSDRFVVSARARVCDLYDLTRNAEALANVFREGSTR